MIDRYKARKTLLQWQSAGWLTLSLCYGSGQTGLMRRNAAKRQQVAQLDSPFASHPQAFALALL